VSSDVVRGDLRSGFVCVCWEGSRVYGKSQKKPVAILREEKTAPLMLVQEVTHYFMTSVIKAH
jgi:hypothetical protein